MDDGITAGLVVGGFGAAVAAACWAQWRGHGRGEDPDALLERIYLLTPVGVMFLLFGLFFLLGSLFPALDGTVLGDAFSTLLLWVAVLSGIVGVALWAWHPQWLRPAWQKRQVEARAARKVRPHGSGPYRLEIVRDREPVLHPQRSESQEDAAELARVILRDDPGADHVLILDSRIDATVQRIDR